MMDTWRILLLATHAAWILCGGLLLALYRNRRRRYDPVPRLQATFHFVVEAAIVGFLTTPLVWAAGRLSWFSTIHHLDRLLFFYLPVVCWTIAWIEGRGRWPAFLRTVAVAVALVGVYSHYVEPRWVEVTRYRIETHKLEAPLRIAVLADIQTDRPGAFEARVLRRTMEASPDLILLPGDFVSAPGSEYPVPAAELARIIREAGLSAPLGVWAVPGNCESYRPWTRAFADTDVRTMERSSRVDLGPLVLTGLDLEDSDSGRFRLEKIPEFHVVFGHKPDFSLQRRDADLLVAGHTHGGQVRLPWFGPPVTLSRVPRDQASGLTRLDRDTTLVVSRGVGMERGFAPRIRFLCRPEIVLIDVVPGDESG